MDTLGRDVHPRAFVAFLCGPAEAQLRPANTGNFATADSAVTAYTNPAGMTRLDRREFVSDTILAYSRSQFKVGNQTTTTGGIGMTFRF